MLADKTHYKSTDTINLITVNPVIVTFYLDDQATVKNSFVANEVLGNEFCGGVQLQDTVTNEIEIISVADNIFDVGVGGDFGSDQQTGLNKFQNIPQNARAFGINLFELFFWAPCDFSKLTVSDIGSNNYYSGQTRYCENALNIKQLKSICSQNGIALGLYVNCHPQGPYAYQLTQNHPKFFKSDAFGNPGGVPPDLSHYNVWNNQGLIYSPPFNPFILNLEDQNVIQYGIDQIKACIADINPDFIRFDGHYTVQGNLNASIRNMYMLRKQVDIPIGFNFGSQSSVNQEAAVGLANGNMFLQESVAASNTVLDNSIESVFQHGGNYYSIPDTVNSGGGLAHPYYSNVEGYSSGYCKFLKRYSSFIWNRNLCPVNSNTKCLKIKNRRFYVTRYADPGPYKFNQLVDILTPENGLFTSNLLTVKTIGLVVNEFKPQTDSNSIIRCKANRVWNGYGPIISGDLRQVKDSSWGVTPFLGVNNQGSFKSGTYNVTVRLWVESNAIQFQCQFLIQTVPESNLSWKFFGHTSDVSNPINGVASILLQQGYVYQDYSLGEIVLPEDNTYLQCAVETLTKTGLVHLDSVAFELQTG